MPGGVTIDTRTRVEIPELQKPAGVHSSWPAESKNLISNTPWFSRQLNRWVIAGAIDKVSEHDSTLSRVRLTTCMCVPISILIFPGKKPHIADY